MRKGILEMKIFQLIVAVSLFINIVGCSDEPSLREIEQGMISSFAREAGTSSANFSARARKIGDGRWSVQLTTWVYGQRRKLNATAVMDADGNIHYYTE